MTMEELRSALFKGATWPHWCGRIQSYYPQRECIPLLVDGRKYGLEFRSPAYKNDQPYLEQMPYRDAEGAPFFPVLEHRELSLWTLDENNEINAACFFATDAQTFAASNLANAIREAFLLFHRSHPQVSQYFFQAQEDFACFVKAEVFGQLPVGAMLMEEVAKPYYGFVMNDPRSAT